LESDNRNCQESESESVDGTSDSTALLQSDLKITHENAPSALPLFKNVIFRHHHAMQKNSSCIETEKSCLWKVLHFNRQNLMLIGPPNDWLQLMAVIENTPLNIKK